MKDNKDIRLVLIEIESKCMDFRNALLDYQSEDWSKGICFGRLKTAIDEAIKYSDKLKTMIKLQSKNVTNLIR